MESQVILSRLSFDDDDSGLGMDFEEYTNKDQNENYGLTPLTVEDLFNDNDHEETCFYDEQDLQLNTKRQREDDSCVIFKRPKCSDERKALTKALSLGDKPLYHGTQNVKATVDRVLDQDDLIADGTSHYKLPTVKGKHSDLKSISAETMRNILLGKYDGVIDSYCIVDCRYPFEYQGGHIQGAINLHTRDMISQFLNAVSASRPQIIIFHCEFSSERGPKLCRYLRNIDRQLNGERYPALYFPEVYILDGGYKEFFYSGKEFCFPRNYIPMLHENYTSEVRHFRSKSKSWAAGQKRRCPQRLF